MKILRLLAPIQHIVKHSEWLCFVKREALHHSEVCSPGYDPWKCRHGSNNEASGTKSRPTATHHHSLGLWPDRNVLARSNGSILFAAPADSCLQHKGSIKVTWMQPAPHRPEHRRFTCSDREELSAAEEASQRCWLLMLFLYLIDNVNTGHQYNLYIISY